MNDFKFFSYIKKYRTAIVLVSIAMGLLFYAYFSGKQSYTASAIIQYRNSEAVQGLAADGTEIDVTEIYSAEVMTKVFEKLGLNFSENNMDAIRAGVRVEAIQSEEESTVQEALNEKGEVSEEKPTMYLVSYTVSSRSVQNAADFSKQILNVMLSTYVETYAENHVNSQIPLYSVAGVYDKDYDYIEMVELLDSAVSRALDQLSYKESIDFRSADTGYSFSDLNQEFSLLDTIDIPNAFEYVLGNKVTKSQDILLSKYENRIRTALLENDAKLSESDGIDEIIDTYVEMMRSSNNTDFTHEYILGEVYDNYYNISEDTRQKVDETTEYDDLMNNYVGRNTEYEHTLIDIAYNEYILDVFSGNVNEGDGVSIHVSEDARDDVAQDVVDGTQGSSDDGSAESVDEGSASGGMEAPERAPREVIVSSQESQNEAYRIIKDLNEKVDMLYQQTIATNSEYNRYAGAENIAIMTDTAVAPKLNLLIYAVLTVAIFGVIGCVAAVVIGRTLEIIDYYMFVDKSLNIANRAGCDRYIAKHSKRPLSNDFVCVSIKVPDIELKNRTYGREKCDSMMADFCKIIRDVFPNDMAFIAKNDIGHFVVFLNDSTSEQARAYMHEIGGRCSAYNRENPCGIAYLCGIACSGKSHIYDIRRLLVESIKLVSKASFDKKIS